MTLLAESFTSDSLMHHQRQSFTRTRETKTGASSTTGAPTVTTATATVTGYFEWLSSIERQDFRGDPAAAIQTAPGQLQAGDTLDSLTLGRFLVLEEGPQAHGEFDLVPLRRA